MYCIFLESTTSHRTNDGNMSESYEDWYQEQSSTDPAPKQNVHFGNYNRRIKAWPAEEPPSMTSSQRTIKSHSEQTNFNTFPRSFGGSKQLGNGFCDL